MHIREKTVQGTERMSSVVNISLLRSGRLERAAESCARKEAKLSGKTKSTTSFTQPSACSRCWGAPPSQAARLEAAVQRPANSEHLETCDSMPAAGHVLA